MTLTELKIYTPQCVHKEFVFLVPSGIGKNYGVGCAIFLPSFKKGNLVVNKVWYHFSGDLNSKKYSTKVVSLSFSCHISKLDGAELCFDDTRCEYTVISTHFCLFYFPFT